MIITIGFVYDWAKKKHASPQKQPPKSGVTSRPAPCDASWSKQANNQWTTDVSHPVQEVKSHKSTPVSAHNYTPLTNIPDNTPMQVEVLDDGTSESPAPIASTYEQEARQAHYDRWRKAILDTQILERKF